MMELSWIFKKAVWHPWLQGGTGGCWCCTSLNGLLLDLLSDGIAPRLAAAVLALLFAILLAMVFLSL